MRVSESGAVLLLLEYLTFGGHRMKKRKMIRRRWVILSVVVLVILVALGILYLLQQDNIKAAANARRYTQEQLQKQLEESRQAVQDALDEQFPDLQVRDLTDEERAALREGTMSREELIAALLGPGGSAPGPSAAETTPPAEETEAPASTTEPPTGETAPPAGNTEPPPAHTAAPVITAAPESTPGPASEPTPEPTAEPDRDAEYQAALAEIIAEVYVLREEYVAKLDAMAAEAKAEYRAKPESERTKSKLVSWASGYASRAGELERQCDAQMNAIVDRLWQLVLKYDADPSIVKTLTYSYAQEKSIQKSLYIQELEKRGIM